MPDDEKTRNEYEEKAKVALDKLKTQLDDLGDAFSKLAGEVQSAVGAAGAAAGKGRDVFLDEWKKARAEREKLLDE